MMTVKHYLQDRLAAILSFLLGMILLGVGLWLDPRHLVRWDTLLYLALLLGLFGVLLLWWGYHRTRRWTRLFEERLKAGADALDWPIKEPLRGHEQALIASAYNELLQAHRQAQSTLIARQQDQQAFIDSWVHEIKVPLAAAGLLQDSLDGKAPEAPLNDLALQLDRINFYVEQVLYYSRLDSFSKDYLLREYDLKQVVDGVIVDQRNSFIDRGIGFTRHGGSLTVVTDEKWLRFILTQLVSNALKYTPRGGTITATIADSAKEATVTIADTGIGIPDDEQHRVFEKGFTGTNGRNANQRATGLGLYLADQLSQKLGHQLTLTSQVGKGTQVTVHFPHLSFYGEKGATLAKPKV